MLAGDRGRPSRVLSGPIRCGCGAAKEPVVVAGWMVPPFHGEGLEPIGIVRRIWAWVKQRWEKPKGTGCLGLVVR